MFRLLPPGLPEDKVYPTTLKELGYFINEVDEIRNVENPKEYFKYFITRTERTNNMHREGMHAAIRKIVLERLEALGMQTVKLPFDRKEEDEPYVPILVSSNIKTAKRVIIVFPRLCQDLGVISLRVIIGRGGINKGSLVEFVQAVQDTDPHHEIGIIITNPGQLRFRLSTGTPMTEQTWECIPRKHAMAYNVPFDYDRNTSPGNRTPLEHTQHVLEHLEQIGVSTNAKIDIVAIDESTSLVTEYMDEHWETVNKTVKLQSISLVSPRRDQLLFRNEDFRTFLAQRGRAWMPKHGVPEGRAIATSEGNGSEAGYGCPVYCAGDPVHEELVFPAAFGSVVKFIDMVAQDENYVNVEPTVEDFPELLLTTDGGEGAAPTIVGSHEWTEPDSVEALSQAAENTDETQPTTDNTNYTLEMISQQLAKMKAEDEEKAKKEGAIVTVDAVTSDVEGSLSSPPPAYSKLDRKDGSEATLTPTIAEILAEDTTTKTQLMTRKGHPITLETSPLKDKADYEAPGVTTTGSIAFSRKHTQHVKQQVLEGSERATTPDIAAAVREELGDGPKKVTGYDGANYLIVQSTEQAANDNNNSESENSADSKGSMFARSPSVSPELDPSGRAKDNLGPFAEVIKKLSDIAGQLKQPDVDADESKKSQDIRRPAAGGLDGAGDGVQPLAASMSISPKTVLHGRGPPSSAILTEHLTRSFSNIDSIISRPDPYDVSDSESVVDPSPYGVPPNSVESSYPSTTRSSRAPSAAQMWSASGKQGATAPMPIPPRISISPEKFEPLASDVKTDPNAAPPISSSMLAGVLQTSVVPATPAIEMTEGDLVEKSGNEMVQKTPASKVVQEAVEVTSPKGKGKRRESDVQAVVGSEREKLSLGGGKK